MLTSKQERFIAAYKSTGDQVKSARIAGYSGKSVNEIACRLMKHPKIIDEISQWRLNKSQKVDLNKSTFVDYAMRDYHETPLIEANRPRYLQLAGQAVGIIGNNDRATTSNTLNMQINVTGSESQQQLWDLTRKMIGNE